MREPADNRVIYRAFKSASAYMDDMYEIYKNLYDLPEYTHVTKLDDQALFEYCLARRYFLLILPYTYDHRILLSPAFSGTDLSWRIVGGSVQDSFDENFVSACQRHITRYVPNILLGEIEPIAFINNSFEFRDRVHTHRGIVFVARMRNAASKAVLEDLPNARGHFVRLDQGNPNLNQPYQDEILSLARDRIGAALNFAEQEDEIEANQSYQGRYVFHDTFVKPIMRAVSRLPIFPHSIAELDSKIREMILSEGCASVLDIACGENYSTIQLASRNNLPLVVGNDISWSQIELLSPLVNKGITRDTNSFVLFTNHDARRLPFRDDSFDCVICKNVLHHMPDLDSVNGLISELRRVGKRSLIVEVMDPSFEGAWGKLRHKYYIDFLKDAGGNFLSRTEFDALTRHPDRRAHFDMETLRGVYQFCEFASDGEKLLE